MYYGWSGQLNSEGLANYCALHTLPNSRMGGFSGQQPVKYVLF